MKFIFVALIVFFVESTNQFELSQEQNLKFSSCVNITKATMANKNDSTFSDVVDNMMIATGGTKDENTKQLLSMSILLCYKNINVSYAKEFDNKTIEDIDPLREENKKLLNLKMLNTIYKEKDITKINEVFQAIKEVKKELGIYDPSDDDYEEYHKSTNEDDDIDDSIIVESKYSKVIGYSLLIIMFVIGAVVISMFLSSDKAKRTRKKKKMK